MIFVLVFALMPGSYAPRLVAAAGQGQPPVITLEDAYARALATDQSIRTAYLEIKKANLLPWSALLSRYGPQISGNGSYDASETTRRTMTDGQIGGGTTMSSGSTVRVRTVADSRQVGLSYDQTLVDFSVIPAWRLGKLTKRATNLQHQFIVRQTLFGVAQAYYEVLKQQAIVEVNRQTVDLAGTQLDISQKRYNVGDVARTDVARARATLEDARRAMIESKNALAVARNTIGNILNLGGDTGFELAEPQAAQDDAMPFDVALNAAYNEREDFKIAQIAVDQDIARRNIVLGEYAPRAVAQLGEDWSLGHASNSKTRSDASSVVVSVQVPVFTGGQREIDLRTANYQIQQTRIALETTTKSIQQEVKTAWLQVRTLAQAIESLKAEVAAALQNYNDLQAQYHAGAAISLDVQTALRDLNNSRATLAGDRCDYQVALRDLKRAEAAFEQERVARSKTK
jgi:outer membrane protein TolC